MLRPSLWQQFLVTYLGLCGSHFSCSLGSLQSRSQNVKSQYQCAQLKVLTTEIRWWLLQQEKWAVEGMKQWHCCILYFDQVLWRTEWKHKIQNVWLSPLTRIHIDVADSSVLPLLFLRSLSILSGCPVIKICSCYQYRKLSWVWSIEYHPHIGFHYSKILT